MNSNRLDGFLGFQANIEELAELLGGHEAVRIVIEDQYVTSLDKRICLRLYGEVWRKGERWKGLWTAATDADFSGAHTDAQLYFCVKPDQITQEWTSELLDAAVRLRTDGLYLERNNRSITLALSYADTNAAARIHPAQKTRRDPWHVFLTDDGETIAKVLRRRPSNASTNAQGLKGAQKTLIRFAETIFT